MYDVTLKTSNNNNNINTNNNNNNNNNNNTYIRVFTSCLCSGLQEYLVIITDSELLTNKIKPANNIRP